jgi:RNA polymerase sigma factor (sigma-70 family)
MTHADVMGPTVSVPGSADFRSFFEVEYPRLLGAAHLLTRNREEAEDLTQEALTRVYERWSRVSRMESPGGYAFRVAANLNRRRLRRLALASKRVVPLGAANMANPGSSDLVLAVRALPRPLREAVILVEWYGYDSTEAGRILGIRASGVRARLHRARLLLEKEFDLDG